MSLRVGFEGFDESQIRVAHVVIPIIPNHTLLIYVYTVQTLHHLNIKRFVDVYKLIHKFSHTNVSMLPNIFP